MLLPEGYLAATMFVNFFFLSIKSQTASMVSKKKKKKKNLLDISCAYLMRFTLDSSSVK